MVVRMDAASVNTPTGGAGGYSYNWTPGNRLLEEGAAYSNWTLTAGTYTCTVTDANSCQTASQQLYNYTTNGYR